MLVLTSLRQVPRMAVDVLNISGAIVKQTAIALFNEVNNMNENFPLDNIFVGKGSAEESILLQVGQSSSGLTLNKILIQDILPPIVDLTPFKVKSVQVAKELGPKDVKRFNNRYGAFMVADEIDVLQSANNYPIELVRDWVLLCRVLGFYELDIGDVTLAKVDDIMYVSVNATHGIYSGYIEVRV